MSKFTPERIQAVLSDINNRVPKLLRNKVIVEVKKTPDLEFVVNEILTKKLLTEEQRNHLQILWDAGDFSKTGPMEDPKVAKQIDQFINREIKKEIKKGNLPPLKDAHKYLPKLHE